MNLKEECESLQSRLNQVLNLVAEAKTSADRLLNITSSQIDSQILDILENCYEGMKNLQTSQEQIELLLEMIGSQSSLSSTQQGGSLAQRNEKKNEFANSLAYQVNYDYLETGGSARINALDNQGNDYGYINVRKDDDGRIRVQDTLVSEKYQRKGIATKLFQAVENKLPDGTVIYLGSNEKPEFWEKMGFQSEQTIDGNIQYVKTINRDEKKTDDLESRFHTLIDELGKTVINTAKSSVAAFMTISGVCTLLLDLNNKATPLQSPEASLFSDVQKLSNDNEERLWINSNFTDIVDAEMVPEQKKKKKKSE